MPINPPITVRAAQLLLLGPLGALVVFGAIYFGAIAPPDDLGADDFAIGAWALVIGAGNLAVGARLGAGAPGLRHAAIALVAVHLLFGAVKVVGYDEAEAATFMVADVVLIALVARLGR